MYCCWLYAVRGRMVEMAVFLRTTGDLSECGLAQLLRMADWNGQDQEYLECERDGGYRPLYWDVGAAR